MYIYRFYLNINHLGRVFLYLIKVFLIQNDNTLVFTLNIIFIFMLMNLGFGELIVGLIN